MWIYLPVLWAREQYNTKVVLYGILYLKKLNLSILLFHLLINQRKSYCNYSHVV